MRSLLTERRLWLGSMLLAFVVGAACRWSMRAMATGDAHLYLIPWYSFARDHGLGALSANFTNYTPAYSYLLLLATAFDGLARPLTLVKAITWTVELANAGLAYRTVLEAGAGRMRAAIAFAVTWLAPTVLLNGAVLGQIDSLWSGLLLLAVFMFLRGRDGAPAFGAAFAVKAQGVFLGPFLLGQIFRGRIPWRSLAWAPAMYLIFAGPVVLAGRPLGEVLSVYLGQAETFHRLSMNAASLWAPLSAFVPYDVGVPVGLAVAAVGGLLLAWRMAGADLDQPEVLLLAAAGSVLLAPFLLPKMHDRYFYAFEILALVLACADRRYLVLAVGAQLSGLIVYLGVGLEHPWAIDIAAVMNGAMLAFVVRELKPSAARAGYVLQAEG